MVGCFDRWRKILRRRAKAKATGEEHKPFLIVTKYFHLELEGLQK